MRTLTHDQARRVYDRVGARQDTQSFYEDPAVDVLVGHAEFGNAQRVYELGCGTGRFALRLLSDLLPGSAFYHGVDLSTEMTRVARRRLASFEPRAEIELRDGVPDSGQPASHFDRFVAHYVLDLLSEEDIRATLDEAHRILEPGGLLCLTTLTNGTTPVSRVVSGVWRTVHAVSPQLTGGCRPLDLVRFLSTEAWELNFSARVVAYGVPSEVLVAGRLAG